MRITVNGLQLFYEKSGSGPPVLLLHGNGEDHRIFDVLAARLSGRYTVYAVDSRGHGQSEMVREFHYGDMVEDVAALVCALGLKKPALYGFSDGGIVGLMLAARYPHLLSRLAVSGVNANPGALRLSLRLSMELSYFFTRSAKIKLMLREPDLSAADLAEIKIPTLLLAGERDIVSGTHTAELAASIPGGVCRILSGETHGSYVVGSGKLYDCLQPFLDR